MELNEKLQELRKQKGLTQEELAQVLYVSRAAISKWESARGYPSIDSLKQIAKYFNVTVDELLSGEELLTLAQEDHKQKQNHLCDLLFGLLDLSALLLLFLPLFGQRASGIVQEVSLLKLVGISTWMRLFYFCFVGSSVLLGVLTLALQNCTHRFWLNAKTKVSVLLNVIGVLMFTVSLQSYVVIFLFALLIIKAFILLKNR